MGAKYLFYVLLNNLQNIKETFEEISIYNLSFCSDISECYVERLCSYFAPSLYNIYIYILRIIQLI
jgi:hypothetical protein